MPYTLLMKTIDDWVLQSTYLQIYIYYFSSLLPTFLTVQRKRRGRRVGDGKKYDISNDTLKSDSIGIQMWYISVKQLVMILN